MDEKAGLPNWALTCLTVHPTPYTESTVEDDYILQIGNDCKAQITFKQQIITKYLIGNSGASSVHMTKHFYDVRLHDLVYMTSIDMTHDCMKSICMKYICMTKVTNT